MKAMTDLKVMQDQYVQGSARHLGMPLADDITGLFERLNSAEQSILNRLKSIESKLRSTESKLGSGDDHIILRRLPPERESRP